MADWRTQDCPDDAPDGTCWDCGAGRHERHRPDCRTQLTPSADLPACRDEDPAHAAALAAAYPDPPEYQHPEDDHG